ncbi:MAG: FAD-binding oxidoreductase, partial [Myxococcales bacterium]|nr:FAD-binding oxidoreductase [Myxococcales bacterium]
MTASRRLSFWGWGYEDRFPDAETRAQLGAQLHALLGLEGAPPTVREPPTLADVRLPDPRVAVPAALAGFCTAAREDRVRHTYGRSYRDLVRGFLGDFSPAPDLVAYPEDEAQIQALLRWAAEARVAVIPRGGGTSVVGGVEADLDEESAGAYAGVVCLDLRALDRVLEVDRRSLSARIQAGATGPAIDQQLAAHDLTLRHFPQSYEFATLGGYIATRSGGHFATVYTHIDEFVQSLRTVTPQGVMESRRLPGSGAGPSPDRLVIGSEGVFGVITEAWMRVRQRPRWRSSASVMFTGYDAAVEAARALAQSGLHPANCRLLDRREAMINGVAPGDAHVLILGFESADHPTDAWMERALERALACGGRCPEGPRHRDARASAEKPGSAGAAGAWRQAFFDGPYLQTALVSLGLIVDTFETACTWDRFPALHKAVVSNVRAAIQRVTGRKGLLTCRFTHVYPDGPAPYFTFIAPNQDGPEAALERWAELKRVASDTLLEHGATITHHHAV